MADDKGSPSLVQSLPHPFEFVYGGRDLYNDAWTEKADWRIADWDSVYGTKVQQVWKPLWSLANIFYSLL